jgi:uncharacterized protein
MRADTSMRGRVDERVFEGFQGKYLSVTSFRRDRTGVATPVWFVVDDGRLLIETDAESYKVKRMRRDPSVEVAVCTARGKLRGVPVRGWAAVLPDTETDRVTELIAKKYRVDMLFIRPLRVIQAALRLGRARGRSVVVAITAS